MRTVMVAVLSGVPSAASDLNAVVLNVARLEIWRLGRCERFGLRQFRLVLASLMVADGAHVKDEDFCEQIWGDDADGGPLLAEIAVGVIRAQIRRKLARLGLRPLLRQARIVPFCAAEPLREAA